MIMMMMMMMMMINNFQNQKAQWHFTKQIKENVRRKTKQIIQSQENI